VISKTKKFEGDIIEKLDRALSMKGEFQQRANRNYCIGQQQYYKVSGEDEFYMRDTDDGFSWKWARLPLSEISIMVIGNLNSYIGTKVNAVEELLMSPISNLTPEIKEPTLTPIKLSEKEMKVYTGSYWDIGYLFASEVKIVDGGLYYTDLNNGWNFPMRSLTKSHFDSPDGTQIEFANVNGQARLILTIPNGAKFYSEKYDAIAVKSQDYSKYTGIYNSTQLSAYFQLIVRDKKLILVCSRKPELELIPIGDNKFRTAEIDFRLIEFEEEKNSVYQMNISNRILKNVEFRKF